MIIKDVFIFTKKLITMKRKILLIIASILMIVIGLLRGFGGIALFLKSSGLETNIPIIANDMQIKLVSSGLLLVCVLLIYSAINLLRKYSLKSWNLCIIALLLFLSGGVLNGFLLFGHPIDKGQVINIVAVIIVSIFLFTGKPAITNRSRLE